MPFRGVFYEDAGEGPVLTEEAFAETLRLFRKGSAGNAAKQIVDLLRRRRLLPLFYNSPAVPILIKLLGLLFGDGNLTRLPDGRAAVAFWGKENDLREVAADIGRLGFAAPRVHSRVRNHRIRTHYREHRFTHTECSIRCGSTALAMLLASLGAPVGNKAAQRYGVPAWIQGAPLWQQRLFLAAFFGAEMSSPAAVSGSDHNFYTPTLSVSKKEPWIENAREFLTEISEMLGRFDIPSYSVSRVHDDDEGIQGRSGRYRLIVPATPEVLIRLYETIGFEYNQEKSAKAAHVAQYLRAKTRAVERRTKVAAEAALLHAGLGMGPRAIHAGLGRPREIPLRFIERSLYEGRKTAPRIGESFESFEEFLSRATTGLGMSGAVWDGIAAIEEVVPPRWVYDFTVDHPAHNFVADGFVVSNCGVRLLRTDLTAAEVRPRLEDLMGAIFHAVPSGVGKGGRIHLDGDDMKQVFRKGARWAVEHGYGEAEDLVACEDGGYLKDADPNIPSRRAVERGKDQLGTLGSGNHFLEVQEVEEVYDPGTAAIFGLFRGQCVVLIHTGSRGCGYQICEDFLRSMEGAIRRYGIRVPDRQLACAPLDSAEGKAYWAAMCAGANFARANRQVITHQVRGAFLRVFGKSPREMAVRVVYDVCHNIGKIEEHLVDGKRRKVCVHRKGATRAFPAGHPEVPDPYRAVGQPVLVPGSMGSASYVLVGTERAMQETFGSTAHGAGRMMSRTQAAKQVEGHRLSQELKKQGIIVRTDSYRGLAEEAPFAYKDVSQVVEVCDQAGISRKVARMRPMGVVKG